MIADIVWHDADSGQNLSVIELAEIRVPGSAQSWACP